MLAGVQLLTLLRSSRKRPRSRSVGPAARRDGDGALLGTRSFAVQEGGEQRRATHVMRGAGRARRQRRLSCVVVVLAGDVCGCRRRRRRRELEVLGSGNWAAACSSSRQRQPALERAENRAAAVGGWPAMAQRYAKMRWLQYAPITSQPACSTRPCDWPVSVNQIAPLHLQPLLLWQVSLLHSLTRPPACCALPVHLHPRDLAVVRIHRHLPKLHPGDPRELQPRPAPEPAATRARGKVRMCPPKRTGNLLARVWPPLQPPGRLSFARRRHASGISRVLSSLPSMFAACGSAFASTVLP